MITFKMIKFFAYAFKFLKKIKVMAIYFYLSFLFLSSFASFAYVDPTKSNEKKNNLTKLPKHVLLFSLNHNSPLKRTKENFPVGDFNYSLTYRYIYEEIWIFGLSAEQKIFKQKENLEKYPILNLSHESLRNFPLYKSFYFAFGLKTNYLYPLKPQNDASGQSKLKPELSLAVSSNLSYFIDETFSIWTHLDYWRGTKTSQIQGFEWGVGLAFRLGD